METAFSIVALLMSGIALGWNIYRDVVKGRLRVQLFVPHDQDGHRKLILKAVNHGPGIVQVQGLSYRATRAAKRANQFVLWVANPLFSDPVATPLPARLEVGQEAYVVFPATDSFLDVEGLDTIALLDTFGRSHWVSRRDIERARDELSAV